MLTLRVPTGFTGFGTDGIQLATHAGWTGDTTGQETYTIAVYGPDNLDNYAEAYATADESATRDSEDARTEEEADWVDLQITGADLNTALPDLAEGDIIAISYGIEVINTGAGNPTSYALSNLRIAFE